MRRGRKDAIEAKKRSFLVLYAASDFIVRDIAPEQTGLINRRRLNLFKVEFN